MNKKGQDLSLTTIILAALGMIILVVLVAILTGQTGKLNIGVSRVQTSAECNIACRQNPAYVSGQFVKDPAACTELPGGKVDAIIATTMRGPKDAELCCCIEKVQVN
ncbi:MAG: hypothetical protein ACE5FT_02335 [Candidatus Nanoarchaeia archaeon]